MNDLPYSQIAAQVKWQKYHNLMNLHYELASLYRATPVDRKKVAALWVLIDERESDLIAMGVEL